VICGCVEPNWKARADVRDRVVLDVKVEVWFTRVPGITYLDVNAEVCR
jgi:hypothetical protein